MFLAKIEGELSGQIIRVHNCEHAAIESIVLSGNILVAG
jgi:hypothetical protein